MKNANYKRLSLKKNMKRPCVFFQVTSNYSPQSIFLNEPVKVYFKCKTCQGFGVEYQGFNLNIRFRPIPPKDCLSTFIDV